jgi:ribosome-associated translation inhibitor RaiA
MKITVNRLGVIVSKYPDRWIAARLAGITAMRQIDEAKVRIIRHRDRSPACEVSIHLVTPGPDLFSSGCDHTMMAAFAKALALLDGTLVERGAKRARRHKGRDLVRRGGKASAS